MIIIIWRRIYGRQNPIIKRRLSFDIKSIDERILNVMFDNGMSLKEKKINKEKRNHMATSCLLLYHRISEISPRHTNHDEFSGLLLH